MGFHSDETLFGVAIVAFTGRLFLFSFPGLRRVRLFSEIAGHLIQILCWLQMFVRFAGFLQFVQLLLCLFSMRLWEFPLFADDFLLLVEVEYLVDLSLSGRVCAKRQFLGGSLFGVVAWHLSVRGAASDFLSVLAVVQTHALLQVWFVSLSLALKFNLWFVMVCLYGREYSGWVSAFPAKFCQLYEAMAALIHVTDFLWYRLIQIFKYKQDS